MSVKFADGKCSSYKREMFRKQFKYSYLKNKQTFFNFFTAFLESTSNSEHFENKDKVHGSTETNID